MNRAVSHARVVQRSNWVWDEIQLRLGTEYEGPFLGGQCRVLRAGRAAAAAITPQREMFETGRAQSAAGLHSESYFEPQRLASTRVAQDGRTSSIYHLRVIIDGFRAGFKEQSELAIVIGNGPGQSGEANTVRVASPRRGTRIRSRLAEARPNQRGSWKEERSERGRATCDCADTNELIARESDHWPAIKSSGQFRLDLAR